MKKIIRFLSVVFYHRFVVIKSKQDCIKRGLKFDENIYGDGINRFNCRSFWYDEFGFRYRCDELMKADDF